MSLRTPLCDLLGVEHPVMLAGMGGVSFANVCAAVSEAGVFLAGSAARFHLSPPGCRSVADYHASLAAVRPTVPVR